MNKTINYINTNSFYAVIIIIAMCFAPYTQLRIGYVGITELVIIILIIKVLFTKEFQLNLKDNNYFIFTKFWLLFLPLSLFGTAYNYLILGHISGTPSSMLFDTMAYLLVFVACFCIEVVLYNYKMIDIQDILRKIYIYSSCILLILFIASQFTNSLFGIPIVYSDLFRPFATNIHHVSMVIVPLPLIGLKLLSLEKKVFYKFLFLLLVVSNIIIAMGTGSLKANIGIVVGIIVFIFLRLSNKIEKQKVRIALFLFLTAIIIFFSTVHSGQIIEYSKEFFTEEDLSGAREAIYTSSISKALESPFVGYGPGSHGEFSIHGYTDTHQTFLTIFIQAGILALLAYFYMIWKIIKTCRLDPFIIGSVTTILLYALGGDIIRRLPMWIFLILLYYYCQNKHNNRLP